MKAIISNLYDPSRGLFKDVCVVVGLLCLVHLSSFAQSVAPSFQKDKSFYQGVPEETQKAWAAVQESLGKSDYASAQVALKTFDSLTAGVEPYQKTYCQLALQILDDSNKPQDSVSSETPATRQELQKKIDALNQQIATEEAKKPDIQKKIQDAEHAGIPSNLDTASSAASRRESAHLSDNPP